MRQGLCVDVEMPLQLHAPKQWRLGQQQDEGVQRPPVNGLTREQSTNPRGQHDDQVRRAQRREPSRERARLVNHARDAGKE